MWKCWESCAKEKHITSLVDVEDMSELLCLMQLLLVSAENAGWTGTESRFASEVMKGETSEVLFPVLEVFLATSTLGRFTCLWFITVICFFIVYAKWKQMPHI